VFVLLRYFLLFYFFHFLIFHFFGFFGPFLGGAGAFATGFSLGLFGPLSCGGCGFVVGLVAGLVAGLVCGLSCTFCGVFFFDFFVLSTSAAFVV